jgi:hypothetical protein
VVNSAIRSVILFLTPERLAGVAAHVAGRVAWTNGTAEKEVGKNDYFD